jgi:hypothetical protein
VRTELRVRSSMVRPLIPADLLFTAKQRAMLDTLGRAVARGELKAPRIVLVFEHGKRRSPARPNRRKGPCGS